jgi:hypothetical protein
LISEEAFEHFAYPVRRALLELYLVESAVDAALDTLPCTYSWEFLQIRSDLLSGIRHLEEIVGEESEWNV